MPSLLSLPIELRLQIFSEVFSINVERRLSEQAWSAKVIKYVLDKEDKDSRFIAHARPRTLFIRNYDPLVYKTLATLTWPCWRAVYEVRCDQFRARILETTYTCTNLDSLCRGIHLLLVNHQLHVEAARLFYSSFTFDFDTHIEAVVPFLADLTPFSRSCVRSIALIKRALPYDKEYDRCEWSTTMRYLSDPRSGISLQCIHLDIIAGMPGTNGWHNVTTYSPADFAVLVRTPSMSWLQELIEVKINEIDVSAIVEHCPPASNSDAMADYIQFSASIEQGLTPFLRSRMTPG